MTIRRVRFASIPGVLIALTTMASLQASSANGPVIPPTIISACPSTGIVISQPGDYILDAGGSGLRLLNCNFSVSGTNGITFTASDVKLNLNNSRLMFVAVSGATPGNGILVRAADGTSRLSNVQIIGAGAVVAFNVGIKLEKVDRPTIDGVSAANNRTSGIETDDVTRLQIGGSMMARNGTYGLKLANSVDGRIVGNTISANGIRTTFSAGTTTVIWPATAPGIGIGIHGGRANIIHKNAVTGNFGDGIAVGKFLAGDSDSVNSFDNEISWNLSSGNLSSTGGSFTNLFVATGSGGNQIHDNESLNLEDDNYACGTNTWMNNTFITTFSSKNSGAAGTISVPLSLNSANVDTGSLSCAR